MNVLKTTLSKEKNKAEHGNPLLKKIKIAVEELNKVKAGKIKAEDFDDLLNALED